MRLPFRFMPASWGLVGDAYDEAEAHYLLKGDAEALERRIVEIRHKGDPKERARLLNDIDFKYTRIDHYTYDSKKNELTHEDVSERLINQIDIDVKHGKLSKYDGDIKKVKHVYGAPKTDEEKLCRDLALLDIDYEHDRIARNAYEKRKATLKNEPWVGTIDSVFDLNQGLDGFRLELDYNSQWIDYLRLNGFVGHTDEQVLEEWFVEVCRSNARAADPNAVVYSSAQFPI